MSILSNKDNPNKWKDKYFDLLDENEGLEKNYQTKEDLLCKTIIRLSLATTGLNKQLDPHLLSIREQLKNGLKTEQLKLELEKLSKALLTLEDSVSESARPNASLLFEFLFQHFSDQKEDIQHIEAKYEKDGYANSQYLIVAINDLIDSVQYMEPIAEFTSKIARPPFNSVDSESICIQIQHLLDGTEIPLKFEPQAEKLKQKLYDNTSLAEVLDETVILLFQIKKHFQSEQQDMAVFLAQLTEQLTELGAKASGAKIVSESRAKKRNLLDDSVSSQMLELQNSSENATELEPLKKIIHSRLEEISRQIMKQRTQDEIERDSTNQQLDFLTHKISVMEQESSQLKNKLITAHQRATHDPLTGLPNRLAYDERFATEFARWKRYKTPLSLLIWDIDFFKLINDTFGHKAGDKTLVLIARQLSQHCRETDFVSRFGGEEFTMLLSDTNAQAAMLSANNIRQIIEKTAFNSNGKKISITISCGITQLTGDDSGESAFKRADEALYAAKENGRNQCVIR
jgi:diguanylate cyclase